ncbi:hypothetical protein C5612_20705 [Pseudomonas frederiksbergensis]|uniref:Uncharacterized protein n=1 Tax=Pseudomonas frederiksbergensis TaxID=104087 RepID=A0A2S8HFP1_9PSED|nr:hypothetical protein C5612_20705 [Pseudomonas frederiksbergensis]
MWQQGLLWRGGLPPLGREAAPKPTTACPLTHRIGWFCDCFAAERGQAPSPQSAFHLWQIVSFCPPLLNLFAFLCSSYHSAVCEVGNAPLNCHHRYRACTYAYRRRFLSVLPHQAQASQRPGGGGRLR